MGGHGGGSGFVAVVHFGVFCCCGGEEEGVAEDVVDVWDVGFGVGVFSGVEGVEVSLEGVGDAGVVEALPPVVGGVLLLAELQDADHAFEVVKWHEGPVGLVLVVADGFGGGLGWGVGK